jgi:anaerobic magnesium-protoporphyrin IX monomethyl ester cyclase
MAADITLVNLNMLYMRYYDKVERELHVPLGTLYLTSALERAGFEVDYRDYQLVDAADPFDADTVARFLDDPAPVLGLSCMANLLPFAILALRRFKEEHPTVTTVLGGVGPAFVEERILERFPWIDMVSHGEGERSVPTWLAALRDGRPLSDEPGLFYRRNGAVVRTEPAARLDPLDGTARPAYHKVDLSRYAGYGMMSSRGCPYPCTFCSVAPIWGRRPVVRSNADVIEEMRYLHDEHGVSLFLFQDEFFVASKERARSFSRDLMASGLDVMWKAFGRIDLTDADAMQAMADSGCVELRFGIESGSDRVLERTKKGFRAADVLPVLGQAVRIFPRADAFYMWGFPFETMEDFHQTVFQMVSARMMGARVLPSLLCFLPQTDIYMEVGPDALEFCEELLPEYMVTGHEVCSGSRMRIDARHGGIFEFIQANRDIFPGFFHYDLAGNVWPKLEVLQEFGFYIRDDPSALATSAETPESCGAHSPSLGSAQLRA